MMFASISYILYNEISNLSFHVKTNQLVVGFPTYSVMLRLVNSYVKLYIYG